MTTFRDWNAGLHQLIKEKGFIKFSKYNLLYCQKLINNQLRRLVVSRLMSFGKPLLFGHIEWTSKPPLSPGIWMTLCQVALHFCRIGARFITRSPRNLFHWSLFFKLMWGTFIVVLIWSTQSNTIPQCVRRRCIAMKNVWQRRCWCTDHTALIILFGPEN